jgi:hypothetical protein
MTVFHSVKEAAQLTGKSPSSIRRIIYPIVENDHQDGADDDGHRQQHPDRADIQPTVEEVRQLRLKGEIFAWRISEELLRREISIDAATATTAARAPSRDSGDANADLLAMLRRELDIKNQQITQHSELIASQMALIAGLSERLREGNILIGSLQQRLALPDVASRTPVAAVATKRSKPTTKKQNKIATEPSKKRPQFLSFLFR